MHAWTLPAIAGLLIAYPLLVRTAFVVPPAIFFVGAGFIAGGDMLGLIDEAPKAEVVRVLAEATLALVLFSDATRIDLRAMRHEYAVPLRLLAIGLPLTIVAGAVAGIFLPGLTLIEALILAVVLAPTDAALGQAVVTDERVPSRIRQGLNVESGLNDGICVPILLIVLAIAEAQGGALDDRTALTLVVEAIGYGVIGGVIAAIIGAFVMRVILREHSARGWVPIIPVVTAGLAYGLAAAPGGSGFIAAFVAGIVFGRLDLRPAEQTESALLEQGGSLLNAVTFIVFGAVIVGPTLNYVDWHIALYAALSLTVVRMIPVAVAMIGSHARRPTVGFLGWFGPRGLASIVFGVIVLDEAQVPHLQTILATIVLTVIASVVAHGLTAAPLTSRYVNWLATHPKGALKMEDVPATAHRLRSAWFSAEMRH